MSVAKNPKGFLMLLRQLILPSKQRMFLCLFVIFIKGALCEENNSDFNILVDRLKNKDALERVKACQVIGRKAEDAAPAIDILVSLLADKNEIELENRNTIVDGYTLGSVNDGPGRISVACFAAEALAAIGPKAKRALPALGLMVQDKNYLTRLNAIKAIVAICNEGDIVMRKPIENALKDEGPLVRREAATALGNLLRGTNEVPEGLVSLLKDTDEYVRKRAISAIQRIRERGEKTKLDAVPGDKSSSEKPVTTKSHPEPPRDAPRP